MSATKNTSARQNQATTESEIKAQTPTTPKGKTADEMNVPKTRKLSVAVRLSRLDKAASTILSLTAKGAEITSKIAETLLDAEALFVGDDGKAGTLPFIVDGAEEELNHVAWAMAFAKLNRSSVGEYLQTARVLRDHPALEGKVESTRVGAMIESALRRKPTKADEIIEALPMSASIAEAKAVVDKKAPKPKAKAPDTTKAEEALKVAVQQDATTTFLATLQGVEDERQVAAIRNLIASVVEWSTSPDYGKGAAFTAVVLDGIYGDTVERLMLMRQRNEERKAKAAAKKAAA